MEIVKNVLIGIYAIVCVLLIILTVIQAKGDKGASGAIVGGSSDNSFYEKNKGRTKEGKMKRWTVILGVVFAVLTIGLGIMYVM